MSTMPEDAGEAALAAQHAAGAAEAAAEAAQRAAGAMEQMSDWMARLASRGEPEEMQGRMGEHEPGVIKRGVMAIGQRISELSDGHYGLSVQPEEKKPGKRAERRARRERRFVVETSPERKAAWFPWMLGLSLGLAIGMIGVAYWQRRRLQQFWGQTSHRAQHVTEGIRQRFEASRGAVPQGTRPEASPGRSTETPDYMSLGSSRAEQEADRQVNGRVESTNQ